MCPPKTEECRTLQVAIDQLQKKNSNLTKQLEQANARCALLSDELPTKHRPHLLEPTFDLVSEEQFRKDGSPEVQAVATALTNAAKGELSEEAAGHENDILPALGRINEASIKVQASGKNLTRLEAELPDEQKELVSDSEGADSEGNPVGLREASTDEPDDLEDQVLGRKNPLKSLERTEKRKVVSQMLQLSVVPKLIGIYKSRVSRRDAVQAKSNSLVEQLATTTKETEDLATVLSALIASVTEEHSKADVEAKLRRFEQEELIKAQKKKFDEEELPAFLEDMKTVSEQFQIIVEAWRKMTEAATNAQNRTNKNCKEREISQHDIAEKCVQAEAILQQKKRQLDMAKKLADVHHAIATRVLTHHDRVNKAYFEKLEKLKEEVQARFEYLHSGMTAAVTAQRCFWLASQNKIEDLTFKVEERSQMELPTQELESKIKSKREDILNNRAKITAFLRHFSELKVEEIHIGSDCCLRSDLFMPETTTTVKDPETGMTSMYVPEEKKSA